MGCGETRVDKRRARRAVLVRSGSGLLSDKGDWLSQLLLRLATLSTHRDMYGVLRTTEHGWRLVDWALSRRAPIQ